MSSEYGVRAICALKEGEPKKKRELFFCFRYTRSDKPLGAVIRRISNDIARNSFIIKEINSRFPEPVFVKIRTDNSAPRRRENFGHCTVATSWLPNVTNELFVFDKGKRRPSGGREKIWTIEIRKPLQCRLEAST